MSVKYKTGNIVVCKAYPWHTFYARENGSTCYLYNTLQDLKTRRNRVLVTPRRAIIRVVDASVHELDLCTEESEEYSDQDEVEDRPTGLTASEEGEY